MKLFTNIDQLFDEMKTEIPKISNTVLEALSAHIEKEVKNDYETRVQKLGPIKHPITKQIMSEMEPKEIAKYVERFVEGNRAVAYIAQHTPADKEGRRQELYGGKPWQAIRGKMQNLDYVNGALSEIGLTGLKAKPI